MKLLDLTPFFHSKSGGIRRYLLEKAKHLSNTSELEHILLVPGKNKKTSYIAKTRVYEIPSLPIPRSGGYRFFLRTKDLLDVITLENPDIVELGGWYHSPDRFRLNSKQIVTVFYHSDPVIITKLSSLFTISEKFLIRYLRRNLSQADLVLVPSRIKEKFLVDLGITSVERVPLGVDPQTFNPTRRDPELLRKLGIDEEKIRIIYVGRLSKEKNIELLLKIYNLLDKRRFHLTVVGDGPKRELVLRAKQEGNSLTYLGYVDDRDLLARIYGSSHILLSTSIGETFGLSFIEAQACGCILVSLDMGLETQPFKEFLVKDLCVESFLEAIELASRSISEEFRQKISTQILSSFSWERTFERLLNVYKNLVKS